MPAFAAAGPAGGALAAPHGRSRVTGPAPPPPPPPTEALGRCQRMLAAQRPPLQNALDRLGDIQPRAAQRRVQRHDAMTKQPQHQLGRFVPGQIVPDQQQAQRRQLGGQGWADGQPILPDLPVGAIGRRGGHVNGWQCGQYGLQFALQPGMQHGIGATRHAFDPYLARRGMEQGQQLGRPIGQIFVRLADRLPFGSPSAALIRFGCKRTGFILIPDRLTQPLPIAIGTLNQGFFASASGSTTVTGPALRRRSALPVSHHERARCQVQPASSSTARMVAVLTWGKPSLALRSARRSVSNDQLAAPSASRSGMRLASVRIRVRCTRVYMGGCPPPWRGTIAATPSRLKRLTKWATASFERRPPARAAAVKVAPPATASRILARATWLAGSLWERPMRSSHCCSSGVSRRNGSFWRRDIATSKSEGFDAL